MKTASFDVDCQRGFSELCPNELPVKGALEIVPELNRQAKICDFRIGSKDAHPDNALWNADKDHPVLSKVGLPNVDLYWPKHCVVGTEGFELLPTLPHDENYDFMVYKGVARDMHPYGACFHNLANSLSTGVIEFIKHRGIELVVVGGLALDYCVATTVAQLISYGEVNVIVNLAATRGIADNAEEVVRERFKASFCGRAVRFVKNCDELVGLLEV